MANKVIHQIQVTVTKDVKSGEVSGTCQAICFSPDINARFGVNLPIEGDGVTDLIESAEAALKENLAEGGHTVTDAEPESEA